MEIDTGVYIHRAYKSHIEEKDRYSQDFLDLNGHGTIVAGIILRGTCKEVKIHSCAFFDLPFKTNKEMSNECFKRALKEKPDIINFSAGGGDPDDEELKILKQLEALKIPLIVAAGNNAHDLNQFGYYPAKYQLKNMTIVGSLAIDGKRSISSNYGLDGMVWEIGEDVFSTLPLDDYGSMSGTSMATAKYTNRWLKLKCVEIHKNVLSK